MVANNDLWIKKIQKMEKIEEKYPNQIFKIKSSL